MGRCRPFHPANSSTSGQHPDNMSAVREPFSSIAVSTDQVQRHRQKLIRASSHYWRSRYCLASSDGRPHQHERTSTQLEAGFTASQYEICLLQIDASGYLDYLKSRSSLSALRRALQHIISKVVKIVTAGWTPAEGVWTLTVASGKHLNSC